MPCQPSFRNAVDTRGPSPRSPATNIGKLPIGHEEIEKAGVQLAQVNEESSVTNVCIAVLAALVGSDARHGTTTFWPSR
jgi:hypothetical protein